MIRILYFLGAVLLLFGAVSRMFLPEYYSYIYGGSGPFCGDAVPVASKELQCRSSSSCYAATTCRSVVYWCGCLDVYPYT